MSNKLPRKTKAQIKDEKNEPPVLDIAPGSDAFAQLEELLSKSTDMREIAFLERMRSLPKGARLQMQHYDKPGTFSWTCPPGVRHAVSIGKGGDAGTALGPGAPGFLKIYFIREAAS